MYACRTSAPAFYLHNWLPTVHTRPLLPRDGFAAFWLLIWHSGCLGEMIWIWFWHVLPTWRRGSKGFKGLSLEDDEPLCRQPMWLWCALYHASHWLPILNWNCLVRNAKWQVQVAVVRKSGPPCFLHTPNKAGRPANSRRMTSRNGRRLKRLVHRCRCGSCQWKLSFTFWIQVFLKGSKVGLATFGLLKHSEVSFCLFGLVFLQ